MSVVLETERLRLRPWRLEDFDAYAAFVSDGCMLQFSVSDGPLNRQQAWTAFCSKAGEWCLRSYGTFVIEEKDGKGPAGYAGLWHPADLDEPELCWSLFQGFHGKGYATEAAMAARNWASCKLGLPPLMSFVHPKNVASRKVAERLGAVWERNTELRGAPRQIFRHIAPELVS